ncbi:MAG TPA: helicase-related protein [Spirochaetota bacterium]|nr:helicase-related protein [Spirochaetota bacterium]HPR49525.1 helicase-related protein [Spirochaetota bacterium]
MEQVTYQPGSLVRARNREWVVMPSPDKDLVLLKPLGGSENEITGIYLPLGFREDRIETAEFPLPDQDDMGDITGAQLLFNAARLSFRNGAGPFRSLARLSFRPRSYQMVPLIMALKQDPVRLLIADDVGVGKTIEALLIVKELLERREVKRFAVLCLPHLCDQWRDELKDKFNIDAVIIRSNTQARLDRDIHGDTSVYDFYPFQVISIDYIKSDLRRQVFIEQSPELIIVDEAHTCARPSGASKGQQQRYSLIHDLSRKQAQHLIMLTATPHSGKTEEFHSLLGLLKPAFETIDLPKASPDERKELAGHFIQRRRADVQEWLNEKTLFPYRDTGEFDYVLSKEYLAFFNDMLIFTQGLLSGDGRGAVQKRMMYWSALALLRGVMSSPAAGVEMLRNRISKNSGDEENDIDENPVLDRDYGFDGDYTPINVVEKTPWSDSQGKKLKEMAAVLEKLSGIDKDRKAETALNVIVKWVEDGYHPVIFCRYIATANYLGEVLAPVLRKKHRDICVEVITSEDPDDVRKERIEGMEQYQRRLLIATDCLSEGINLQEGFTAVLHYDLPWNPNRLEQREGRVDRFGQQSPEVKAYLLYSKENPIDGVVLRVLLRKVREIRKSIGISIPFPEDSVSVMDAVMNAVLINPQKVQDSLQLHLDFGETDPVRIGEVKASKAYDEAAEREKMSRSIFAQHAIKAEEIEEDLRITDDSIGDPVAVRDFVLGACNNLLGAQVSPDKKGYVLFTANLPPVLKSCLPEKSEVPVSFDSPTPEGYLYLGRNHIFVEQLCQLLLALSFDREGRTRPARAAVIRCRDVQVKTTVLLFRVRNVIENLKGTNQIVAEEMIVTGYQGSPEDEKFLEGNEAKGLLFAALPSANMTPESQQNFLDNELKVIETLRARDGRFDRVSCERAAVLVQAHERYRKLLGGDHYQVVKPVLPMDIMGLYILLPDGK